MAHIKAGWGYNVDYDFNRVAVDTPIEIAPKEYARPGHVIGYIAGDKASKLSFMRSDRVRVHVTKRALGE